MNLATTAGVREHAQGTAAHAAYLGVRHFASLDGIRCFCILGVIWHHSPVVDVLRGEGIPLFATRGFLGVDFFFILSGFLITTLLMRERRATGRISLRQFYWRRALRILPVYLLVVSLLGAWAILVKGETHWIEYLPFYYFFLSNFLQDHIANLAPTWSLSVEEQYYLLWPLLLLLLPIRARWLLPAVALVWTFAGGLGLVPLAPWAVTVGPAVIAPAISTYAPILIGSGLALLFDSPTGFALFRPWLGHRLAALPALAVLIALLLLLPEEMDPLERLALHLSMAVLLAAVVLREDNVLRPALAFRPVARIGAISYGVYLYHLIALHVASVLVVGAAGAAAQQQPWAVLGLYTLIAVAMAELSFRSYEAVFRRLRHKPSGTVRAAQALAERG